MKWIIVLFFVSSILNSYAQDQMYDICPLKIGEQIPEAILTNDSGEEIQLSDIISIKPSVLIFYRGAWCGYCTQHLAELNSVNDLIDSLGFQAIGITIDQSKKIIDSTNESGDDIPVYSDSKAEVMNAFGLNWKLSNKQFDKYKSKYKIDLEEWSGEDHHSLPVPSIYVIKDGVVEFQYVNPNYRQRLKPETLIAILETLD